MFIPYMVSVTFDIPIRSVALGYDLTSSCCNVDDLLIVCIGCLDCRLCIAWGGNVWIVVSDR